jgi:hypothetical protein
MTNLGFVKAESGTDGCFGQLGSAGYVGSYEPPTVEATGYKTAFLKVPRTRVHRMIVTLVPSDSTATSQILLVAANGNDLEDCKR